MSDTKKHPGNVPTPETRAEFLELVKDLQTRRGLSRREAMYRVKCMHPEAREAFKGGPID